MFKPMTRWPRLYAFLTAPNLAPASQAASDLALAGVAKAKARIEATHAQLRRELGR